MTEEDEFAALMSEADRTFKRRVWIVVIILAVLFWVCVIYVAWRVFT